jgi:hypothetical protein
MHPFIGTALLIEARQQMLLQSTPEQAPTPLTTPLVRCR